MKNQAWRRQHAAYPMQGTLQPRITDVDLWQHLNNVAQIGMHFELQQQWLQVMLGDRLWRSSTPQLALRAGATDFLAEAHYPAPLATGVRLLGVDAQGLQLGTALFQHGHCVGLHQATLGLWADGLPAPLPDELAARAQAALAAQPPLEHAQPPRADAPAPAALPALATPPHPDAWPWQLAVTARFGDADARGQTSDHTLARCVEQGRVQFLTRVFGAQRLASPVGFMVAHVALRWHHRRPIPSAWQLGTGVQRVGERSISVATALFDGADCLAEATSVMVVIDHATRRPTALPSASRAALAPYLLPGA
jgi:acyl-CoA thioester hydrolase